MWLVRCLESLLGQTHLPDEVIAVMRDDDEATHQAFESLVKTHDFRGIMFGKATVSEPGFLPPVIAGIESASCEVLAFLDDDAEAQPNWLERLLSPYSDPSVAGVGGRYVNIEDGKEAQYPIARRVGQYRWYGSFEGNMYRDLSTDELRDVDFFMGGNMSYRRDALRRVRIDSALANDVAFHYEVDLGRQVKSQGGRLVYDPLARIRHYSAPRAQAGMRKPARETIFWYSHNTLYIAMKHSTGPKRTLALAYSFAIGSSRAWGFASAFVATVRQRSPQPLRELHSAFAGKLRAVRSLHENRQAVAE
jgi:GT2 family glycosyltransferase